MRSGATDTIDLGRALKHGAIGGITDASVAVRADRLGTDLG